MTSKKNYYQTMKPNLKLRNPLTRKKIPMLLMTGKSFLMKGNDR